MKRWIVNLQEFINRDLWSTHDSSPKVAMVTKQIKLLIISIYNSSRHSIGVGASALTFYSLTSLVPVLALIFAISKGFGFETKVIDYIASQFSQYSSIVDNLTRFATAYLENSSVGILAGAGFVVLGWSVVMVFSNIEGVFNSVWGIKRQRTISKRVINYLAVVIVIPIIVFIQSSLSPSVISTIAELTAGVPVLESVASAILWVLSNIPIFIIFTSAYFFFPNTKVNFLAALYGAAIAGTGYIIFENAYIYFQRVITSYSAIYGSFAALPLFLIWMNVSWLIILFGAELSSAFQNLNKYEYEIKGGEMSRKYRHKLSLLSLSIIINNFIENKGAPTAHYIAQRIGVSTSSIEDILFSLEQAKLVISLEVKEGPEYSYTPAYDLSSMSVVELINKLDSNGNHTEHELGSNIEEVFSGLYTQNLNSKNNPLVRNIKYDK